ncbi:MAG TPA: RluA family pseudouridine synthase [Deltaproteobacteria bacterium]|nr:RluA family pseudouridine synthase [Deltaproteobacteria bacterium]
MFTIQVESPDQGKRLDSMVGTHLPELSRSVAAILIRSGAVRVNEELRKPGYRVKPGDLIHGTIPPPEPVSFVPEPIPLDILYEDSDLIVVNKPPGLVVHPAPGHAAGTLVNGLLHHCPGLQGIGTKLRPGIVHRLDKDTSGTLVVAKSGTVHRHLSYQFKTRHVEKKYLALVLGEVASDSGVVKLPIGRHPVDRKKMSTISHRGRSAETVWRIRERFPGISLLELDLKTGRTHQIRVHCAAIRHPVIGDPVYSRPRAGGVTRTPDRQMLHSWRLGFTHPASEQWMCFESPIPEDMKDFMEALRSE